MAIRDEIIADFEVIRQDIPVTVTYAGTNYSAVRSVLSQQRLFSEGGYGNDYDFSVRISEDDLTANSDNPKQQEKVTVDSVVYRILDSRRDNFNAIRRLDLTGEY
jgi:hypothetical protein